MAKEKSLKVNSVLNIIKQVMNLIFPLITFPYSSRILNPEGIGKVNFALSIVTYFALLASLGIGGYATRESAKIRDNKILFSQFAKEIILINFITTVISYTLFFVAVYSIPQFKDIKLLLCVCSSTILFSTFGVEWLYKAKEEYVYITVRGIIFQFISLALLFILVKEPDDYVWYASINVTASVGSNLLNFINLRKYITLKTNLKYQLKKHIKPVLILFASAIAVKLYNELDKTMIGFLSTDEQVGYYSAATKLSHLVINLIVAATAVISPRLSNYFEHDRARYYSLLEKSGNFTLMICVPFAAGLFIMATPLTNLMCGESFAPSINVMRVMSLTIFSVPVSSFCSAQIFLPCRKDKYSFYPVLIGAIVNTLCNVFLILKLQALGAGIATSVAEGAVTFFSILLAARTVPEFRGVWKYVWHYIIAAFFMSLAIIFANSILNIENFGFVLAEVAAGILIYFSVLLLLRNKYLMEFVKAGIKKIRRS